MHGATTTSTVTWGIEFSRPIVLRVTSRKFFISLSNAIRRLFVNTSRACSPYFGLLWHFTQVQRGVALMESPQNSDNGLRAKCTYGITPEQ